MTVASLSEVNALTAAEFVARYGDIAEHSSWVAEAAAARRPFATRAAMAEAFAAAIEAAERPARLALIREHPDLAGRAALAGELALESRREQTGAGLDSLTPAELARFTELNDAYKAKFGFPFILAVKGATKQVILDAFVARLPNDPEVEFAEALRQVARIIRFRIEDRVLPG